MRKGPAILIVIGLGLLAFLYFSPVTPSSQPSQEEEVQEDVPPQNDQQASVDQQVDEALEQLQSGTVPPMQAILKIRELADAHPENVKANFTLGSLSMQTAQYDKAVSRFEKVLKVEPDNASALQLRAKAFSFTGDTTAAIEDYQKALLLVTEESQKESINRELQSLKKTN